jgi:uncharacterized protein (TIGR03437 family)
MTDPITRKLVSFTVALLACAAAQAATINTTLTVTATVGVSGTSVTADGTATFTNTNIGSGTFSATLSLTSTDSSGNYSAPFTIKLSGGSDTITGTLKVPPSVLAGTGTGSATITGGTGTYLNATGSFPSLAGTGGLAGTAITLTFTGAGTIVTGGGGGPAGPPAPSITAVLDAGSYTRNIAQGSIFVVKGTNLSASGFTQLSFPLPATSGGVKITFAPTAGGAGTDAWLVYLYNQSGVNQLAAVLPSTVAAGNYNVTVTYNGTASAPFAATVVPRKLGLITADGSGTGLAVVQNFVSQSQLDIGRFTTFSAGGFTFSPSKPGQVLIAWATGMGAVAGGDNTASPGFDFTKNGVDVKVIVGGVTIAPLYAGRAPGLAGADQINFQLPANVPTGCIVSFQVSVNNALSNPIFIAIAPDANSSACVQPGFTAAQLQQFDNGASRTIGAFSLSQFSIDEAQLGTVKLDSASGVFIRYTGFQLAALSQNQAQQGLSSGSCNVTHSGSSSASQTIAVGAVAGLDAGAVTLNGPAGSGLTNQAYTQDPNTLFYSINLGTEGVSVPGLPNLYKLVAGQYTVTGAGGRDVGKFNTSLTLGSPLTLLAALPNTVNRSAGLTLNWTGGNPSDLVEIIGSSSTVTGTGTNASTDSWTFICTATAGAGTFTVPSSILTQLPAVAALSTTGAGFLEFASVVSPSTFTAPLTAGGSIDVGAFLSLVGFGGAVSFQ